MCEGHAQGTNKPWLEKHHLWRYRYGKSSFTIRLARMVVYLIISLSQPYSLFSLTSCRELFAKSKRKNNKEASLDLSVTVVDTRSTSWFQ